MKYLIIIFLVTTVGYSQINPIVTVTPVRTYVYNGSPQGPFEASNNGTSTSYTFSYVGTGSTSYGPTATLPTAAGTYTATAIVEANASFNATSSQPTAFTIFGQDPLKLFLTNIPTVSQVISTTDSGSGTAAIITKRFTFKWEEDTKDVITKYIERTIKSTAHEKRDIDINDKYNTLPYGYKKNINT